MQFWFIFFSDFVVTVLNLTIFYNVGCLLSAIIIQYTVNIIQLILYSSEHAATMFIILYALQPDIHDRYTQILTFFFIFLSFKLNFINLKYVLYENSIYKQSNQAKSKYYKLYILYRLYRALILLWSQAIKIKIKEQKRGAKGLTKIGSIK